MHLWGLVRSFKRPGYPEIYNRNSFSVSECKFPIFIYFLITLGIWAPPQLIPGGRYAYLPGDAPVAPRILTQVGIELEIMRLTTQSQVRPYR